MQTTPIEINLALINQKVKFSCVSSAKADQPITVDYLPPLGDGEGFLGLELLVMSFGGCVSTGIVGILRRMGKSILNYSMAEKISPVWIALKNNIEVTYQYKILKS